MISLIAVLKAKPGQTDALRQALQALLLPTRQEPGNLDYALFQLRDAPDTFYMREAWQGQDALDAHVAMPYFQAFMTQMESLLAEPLRLDFLTPVLSLSPPADEGWENHAPPPRGFKSGREACGLSFPAPRDGP